MNTSRRKFASGLAALSAGVAIGTGSGARAADPVIVGTLPIDAGAQPYYADRQGFFSASGIDATISPAQNSSLLIAAVVNGSMQFTLCNIVNLVEALQNGLGLVMVAPGDLWSDDTTRLVVAKDSPIRTARDLTGKTIAVTGLKNLVTFAPQYWIDRNGGDASKVHFIELSFPEMVPAMQAGRVDAAVTVEPFLTISKDAIRPVTPALLGSLSRSPLQSAVWVAEARWAKQNASTVSKFADVMVKASVWANSNLRQSGQILAGFSKMNPDLVSAMARVTYATRIDLTQIQPLVDLTTKYEGFKSTSIAGAVFHT